MFIANIVKRIHKKVKQSYILNSITMTFDSQAARVGLHDVVPTCNMEKMLKIFNWHI